MDSDNYFQNSVPYFQDFNMGNPSTTSASGLSNSSIMNLGGSSSSLLFLNKGLNNSDFQNFTLQPSAYLSNYNSNNNNSNNNINSSPNTNNSPTNNNNSNNINNNIVVDDFLYKKVSANNIQVPTTPPKDLGFIQNILQQQQEIFQKKLSEQGITNLPPDQLQFMFMQEQQKYLSNLNNNNGGSDLNLPPLDNYQFQASPSQPNNSSNNNTTNNNNNYTNLASTSLRQQPPQQVPQPTQQPPQQSIQSPSSYPSSSSLQQLQQQQMQQLLQIPGHIQPQIPVQQQQQQQQQKLPQQAPQQLQSQIQQPNKLIATTTTTTTAATVQPTKSKSKKSKPKSEDEEFIDENEDKSKNKSRSSQNIASRNYRQRKKDHIQEVEFKVQQLTIENERLRQENHILKKGDLGDVMRPDFDFQTVLLESQKLMSQLQEAVNKEDHATIENLLQLYYFASQLRTTVVEREVEKIVHPYTQARLAVMGYRSNAETSILLRPFSTNLWWPKFADEVGLTEDQRKASDILWSDHLKIDMELRTERDQLDREVKELFLKKIVSHGTKRPELLFDREITYNSEIDYPSSPHSSPGSSNSSNSPPTSTSSPTVQSPPDSPQTSNTNLNYPGINSCNNNNISSSTNSSWHHSLHSPYPMPQISSHVSNIFTENNKPLELSELLEVTRKLEMLKKNFVKHRNLICDTDLVLSTILTPFQHAKLILRLNSVTCYDFSIVDTITGIWGTINSNLKDGSFIQNLMPDQDGKFEVLEKFKQNQMADIKNSRPMKLESLQKTYEKLYQTVLGSDNPNCTFSKQNDYQHQNLLTASPNYAHSPTISSPSQQIPNSPAFDLSAPIPTTSSINNNNQNINNNNNTPILNSNQINIPSPSSNIPNTPSPSLDSSKNKQQSNEPESTKKNNKAKKFQWYSYKTPSI